jgi:hypothetical protein
VVQGKTLCSESSLWQMDSCSCDRWCGHLLIVVLAESEEISAVFEAMRNKGLAPPVALARPSLQVLARSILYGVIMYVRHIPSFTTNQYRHSAQSLRLITRQIYQHSTGCTSYLNCMYRSECY